MVADVAHVVHPAAALAVHCPLVLAQLRHRAQLRAAASHLAGEINPIERVKTNPVVEFKQIEPCTLQGQLAALWILLRCAESEALVKRFSPPWSRPWQRVQGSLPRVCSSRCALKEASE